MAQGTGDLGDANFPKDGEGRVYHVGLKYGELSNRIVIMGCPQRAKTLSALLDQSSPIFVRETTRGFTTYTGRYKNVPLSIMAIGMGPPMVDFMYRECRNITKGPLGIIRLGTCGTPRADIDIGSITIAESSQLCVLEYEKTIQGCKEEERYSVTTPLAGDPALTKNLKDALTKTIPEGHKIILSGDLTAESFYSTQGRIDPNFNDQNTGLIDSIVSRYPDIGSIQMETYTMYYLSKICVGDPIYSTACGIVLAQRKSGAFLSHDKKHELEKAAGIGCLDALLSWGENQKNLMDADTECVWNKK